MHKFRTLALACTLAGCAGQADSPAAGSSTPVGKHTPPTASTSTSGAAGSAANVPTSNATPSSVATTPSTPPTNTPALPPSAATPPGQNPAPTRPAGGKMLAMDECGLKTQYVGDEYCINAPPTEQGFQLHIGPTDYENPDPKYVLQPGEENVVNLPATSGNDKDVQYYYRQYRMRPGSHHAILTAEGRSIGGTQNLARDNPELGIIPPENEGVGLPLPAHASINANMHFYNFSDKPMLRELWVNYWYKDPAQVNETARGIFSMTGVTAAVAHSHVVVGASCPVTGTGRVLALSGHRHLNNVRFSAWLNSGGKKQLVFEDYDAEHPTVIEFNSLTTNSMADPTTKTAGGASGILNVKQGDTFDFECEIVNNTDKNFYGANEASDDEMCILTGDLVGARVTPGCRAIPARSVTSTAD